MNRLELIDALSNEANISKTEAARVVRVFFDDMADALARGDRVEIRGLCSFYVKQYATYTGRNPKTGEKVKIEPKKLPFFKPGKELKERVDYLQTNDMEETIVKDLEKDLLSVRTELNVLAKKFEKIQKQIETLDRPKAVKVKTARKSSARKAPARRAPAKKVAKITAADTVLGLIERSKQGIDAATLIKETGFDRQRVYDIIYGLKKQGKIGTSGWGGYVKA